MGPDRSEFHPALRGVLIDNYIAFYMIEANHIAIVRVLDSRMNVEDQFNR